MLQSSSEEPVTVAEIARSRKNELKSLLASSRRLDTVQEAMEREVLRIKNRKKAVPELEDAERLIKMAQAISQTLANLVALLEALARAWS
jgi:hypothetical protein